MMIPRNSGPVVYIILDENRSLNTKETTKKKTRTITKAAVKRATKNV